MSSEQRVPLETGVLIPAFADYLAPLECYGPVTHLLFCYTQRAHQGGQETIVACRVIVPTAILSRLARQLTCPEAQEPVAGDDGLPDNVIKLH
jgi:hypothetical protein